MGGPSSDVSFFSFGMNELDTGRLGVPGGVSALAAGAARASAAPMPATSDESSMGFDGIPAMLPSLGFLEESAGLGEGLGCADESVHGDEVCWVSRVSTPTGSF